jgi:hypothetical protein
MSEEDQIKEIFAHYGRAMFVAQTLEKSIMNLIVFAGFEHGITQDRYEELRHEKSQLTFGLLKREFITIYSPKDEELNLLESFHGHRDELAHSFWWNNSVEFAKSELRPVVLNKLFVAMAVFDSLQDFINRREQDFIETNKIDVEQELAKMMNENRTVPFPTFRELTKNETVIDLFGYKNSPNTMIPIFILEDNTSWSLCEKGLSQFTDEIHNEHKVPLKEVKDVLPIRQFNPRPKVKLPWNFGLDLKIKGRVMKVSRINKESPFLWRIE